MFQNETQTEEHLERSTALQSRVPPPTEEVQRKRMLMALGILLVALVAVVLKDWDFWFPPTAEQQEAVARTKGHTIAPPPAAANDSSGAHTHKMSKNPPTAATAPGSDAPFTATAQRAALPPLDVEVVAGNRHINVPAKSNAIRVDVDSGSTSSAAPASTSTTSATAGNRVQISPQIAQTVSVSVPPDYPLLARQMKVQGAVSLQALISRDGTIQELEILSGPAILAAAAREAVKQWHFKPFLQNGQPVETQARITVNFTISTN
jgi:periplasmic protein TonB